MAEYYLISQLPSLDGISDSAPLPITEERFLELCESLLKPKIKNQLKNLTLTPPLTLEKSSSTLIEAWNDGERKLRLALGKIRANKLNKSFDLEIQSLPIELVKIADMAIEIRSPFEAEKFLTEHRLKFLESLRPMDNFKEDFIYYYGLKLKLISRIKQFDVKLGEVEYKNIYNSILDGVNAEAMQ